MEVQTVRIALFKHPKYGYTMIREEAVAEGCGATELVRASDYLTVDFVLRSAEDLVPERIAVLDAEIAKATAEFAKVLDNLKTQKANLLALTDARPVFVETQGTTEHSS